MAPAKARRQAALCGGRPHLMPSACQAQLLSSWPVAQFVPSAVRSTSRQPLTGPVPSRRRAAACSAEIPQRSGCSGRRASSRATQGMGEYLLPPSRAFAVPSARFHFPREAKSGTALCGGHPHLVPRMRQAPLLSSRQARRFPPLMEPGSSLHSAAASSAEAPQRPACSDRWGPSRAAYGQGEYLLPPDSDFVIASASSCLSREARKK